MKKKKRNYFDFQCRNLDKSEHDLAVQTTPPTDSAVHSYRLSTVSHNGEYVSVHDNTEKDPLLEERCFPRRQN